MIILIKILNNILKNASNGFINKEKKIEIFLFIVQQVFLEVLALLLPI